MDITRPTALLGGLSPQRFMRRHWQSTPLLIRSAVPTGIGGAVPLIDRSALFELAGDEAVQSRLVVRDGMQWALRHGPFARRQLPPLKRPDWTLLVQGVDRQVPAAQALLSRFRFVPDVRLDDVMVSYASDGGGVGPHRDSYDVFLLQLQGQRRWRLARASRSAEQALLPDLPLRILARFEAEQDWLLAPGDMLYVPPGWAHEGTAVGACMTCSIGFRAPSQAEAARETLARLIDDADLAAAPRFATLYRDERQAATTAPAALPEALVDFARHAAARLVHEPHAIARAVGTWLSEPPPDVWFDAGAERSSDQGVQLDRRSRVFYDADHVFINGTVVPLAPLASSADDGTAPLRLLADARHLTAADLHRCSPAVRAVLEGWLAAGWLHASDDSGEQRTGADT